MPAPNASSGLPGPKPQTSFTFDTTAAASRPTAPLPQMFTAAFAAAGPAKSQAPGAKACNTSKPHPGVSAFVRDGAPTARSSSTMPSGKADAALPINPFSPDAPMPRGTAAGRGARNQNKPAAAATATETAAPELVPVFTFGHQAGANATAAPSLHTAGASEPTAARARPGRCAAQDDKQGPAQDAPRVAPQPAAGAPSGFGLFRSPRAKAAGPGAGRAAAPNPFGSPMTPLERSGAAGLGSPGDRRPVQVSLFGADPAAAAPAAAGPAATGAATTPVFQARRNAPVAGATPPSTDGPSTAGSPFGGPDDAQNWFQGPASGGSAARRRGGRVLRCARQLCVSI